jgi:hypothetical protein
LDLLGARHLADGSFRWKPSLANSSASGEHDEVDSPVVTCGLEACADDMGGHSSDRCVVMVQATNDPPYLVLVLPEMMIQGAKEHAKVDVQIVEDLKVFGAPCTVKSSKELIYIFQ